MEQPDLLRYVTELLERLGIEHMLVGSIASMAYGESRFTLDIDIVVDLDQRKVRKLCASFPESDFYVSQSAAEEPLISRRQFNVIHPKSGLKIDFMFVRETEMGSPPVFATTTCSDSSEPIGIYRRARRRDPWKTSVLRRREI